MAALSQWPVAAPTGVSIVQNGAVLPLVLGRLPIFAIDKCQVVQLVLV